MRIVFTNEYWPPYAPGGAEWTSLAWGEALQRAGHTVLVVTPGWRGALAGGAPRTVPVRVFPVGLGYRVWFGLFRNPVWSVYTAVWIWWHARRFRGEVIHCQGKGMLVGSWLAARVLGIPVVATVRDVGYICPLGLCLHDKEPPYRCSYRHYTRDCIPKYLPRYEPRATRATRLRRWVTLRLVWADHLLRRWVLHRRIDGIVGVSQAVLDLLPDPERDAVRYLAMLKEPA